MDKATLKETRRHIRSLEKEMKLLERAYDRLIRNMHKYTKQEYEEQADVMARKIAATGEKYTNTCQQFLEYVESMRLEA